MYMNIMNVEYAILEHTIAESTIIVLLLLKLLGISVCFNGNMLYSEQENENLL